MHVDAPSASSPDTLADQLERDIRRRNMQAGERYLSTRQVQQRYRVPISAAIRAMELLVNRQVLERRDRSGTFIGPRAPQKEAGSRVKVIYVFIREYGTQFTTIILDQLILSLSRLRPESGGDAPAPHLSVQFASLPEGEEVAMVKDLMRTAQATGQLFGVVAISCGRDVYRYLDTQGIPTVVFGSLDPDLRHMPSVDADYFDAGRLMARYLIDRGHETLGMLGVSRWNPGDHAFMDGVAQAMTEAGRPPNALVTRLCQQDSQQLVFAHAESLMTQHGARPLGLICRSEAVAQVALKAATQLGLRVPEHVDIVFECFATAKDEHLPYPYVQTCEAFEQIAGKIGRMLTDLYAVRELSERQVVIPVELQLPPSSA